MKNSTISLQPKQLSAKIFMRIFITCSICIFVISLLLYQIFEKSLIQNKYETHISNLLSVSKNLSQMKSIAKSTAVQTYFDLDLFKMLFYDNPSSLEQYRAKKKLDSIRNSNPFLKSVYVFKSDRVYLSGGYSFSEKVEHFSDKDFVKFLKNIRNYSSGSLIPRKIYDERNPKFFSWVYSYVFYESKPKSENDVHAVMLNISQDWLRSNIEMFNTTNNRILIIDNTGKVVINDIEYPILSSIVDKSYIKSILASSNTSGSFRISVDGVDSLVTFAKTNDFDYSFIAITPYKDLVKNISRIKVITYLSAFALILCLIPITIWLTKRLSSPLFRIIDDLENLKAIRRRDYDFQRQKFLCDFINNSNTVNLSNLIESSTEWQLKTDFEGEMFLVIMKIDNYIDFCNDLPYKDRSLMKFAIINISSELCSPFYKGDLFDYDDQNIVMLLNTSGDSIDCNNSRLHEILKTTQENVLKHLNISISITVGRPFSEYLQAKNSLMNVMYTSHQRIVCGHQSILFEDTEKTTSGSAFEYPIKEEKMVMDEFKLSHLQKTISNFDRFIEYISQFDHTIIKTAITSFAITFDYVLKSKISNNQVSNYTFATFISHIEKMETLSEIKDYFYQLFKEYCVVLDIDLSDKHQKYIEQSYVIINENLSNLNLSLDFVAEIIGISSTHLGRIFKKHKGESMVDYINSERIKFAHHKIITTKIPINKIMEQSGFSSRSHFNSLFKKALSVSPSELRSRSDL